MTSRRLRLLSREERLLWEAVARTAAPIGPPVPDAVEELPAAAPPAPVPPPPRQAKAAPRVSVVRPVAAAAPSSLDRRTLGRISRGSITIDARLDLHGLTQDEAHRRLLVFLGHVQSAGGRIVLVITGKGRDDPTEPGILRRALPHWLALSAFRPLISGYEQAHRIHGGTGAFYIRLRRHDRA